MPAGGNIVEGILVFLGLVFGAAIAALLIRFWNDTSMQRDTMTDRQRWLIYGSLGAIALMIVGTDELLSSGAGTVAWVASLASRLADLQHLARGPEHLGQSPVGGVAGPRRAESSRFRRRNVASWAPRVRRPA